MVYDALSKKLYFSNKLDSTLGDFIFAQEYAINMHQTAYEPANCFLIGQTDPVNIHQVLHCRKQETKRLCFTRAMHVYHLAREA